MDLDIKLIQHEDIPAIVEFKKEFFFKARNLLVNLSTLFLHLPHIHNEIRELPDKCEWKYTEVLNACICLYKLGRANQQVSGFNLFRWSEYIEVIIR